MHISSFISQCSYVSLSFSRLLHTEYSSPCDSSPSPRLRRRFDSTSRSVVMLLQIISYCRDLLHESVLLAQVVTPLGDVPFTGVRFARNGEYIW